MREKVGLKVVKALKRKDNGVTHAAIDVLCALMQVRYTYSILYLCVVLSEYMGNKKTNTCTCILVQCTWKQEPFLIFFSVIIISINLMIFCVSFVIFFV